MAAHRAGGSRTAPCQHFTLCNAAAGCPLPAGLLDTAATNAQVAAELKTALAAAQASGGDVATLLVLSAMNKYTGEAAPSGRRDLMLTSRCFRAQTRVRGQCACTQLARATLQSFTACSRGGYSCMLGGGSSGSACAESTACICIYKDLTRLQQRWGLLLSWQKAVGGTFRGALAVYAHVFLCSVLSPQTEGTG